MPDPTIQFIETNWSLISDIIMEYLRACGTEQEVAALILQWKELVQNLGKLSPKIPAGARDLVLALPRGVAQHKKLDVAWWTMQLKEWSLLLQYQLMRQQRKGG